MRLTTWIAAPEERCFGLATCAEFHGVLAKGREGTASHETVHGQLNSEDRLVWPGHTAGLQVKYTTRIEALRPPNYFREVLDQGCFQHFEHHHHFTFLNDGTRMRDELRFSLPPGPQCLITIPLLRRYLASRIGMRNQILKMVAETEMWKSYLPQAASQQEDPTPGPSSIRKRARSANLPAGQMAAHRG